MKKVETTKKENIEELEVNKKEKVKKIGKRIFDIVFWVLIISLAAIWLTDFFRVQNEKKPIFCLNEKTHEFDDGTVYECKGLGYKVYQYDRESINNAHQFSPFFVGMKK